MSGHTPGPWYVAQNDEMFHIIGPAKNCNRNGIENEWDVALVEDDFTDARPREERAANARLIAAAPDLLAALKSMVACVEIIGSPVGDMDNARAVIAKAEGRAS